MNVITLMTEAGEEIDFEKITEVSYRRKTYYILKPVQAFEGVEADEAFVFGVSNVKGEEHFDVVTDDKIIDGVFAKYDKMFEEKKTDKE